MFRSFQTKLLYIYSSLNLLIIINYSASTHDFFYEAFIK